MSELPQDEVARILAGLYTDPPISEEALASLTEHVAEHYETALPDDYVAFLRRANGADGSLENGVPIVLWKGELLPRINDESETERWMPGNLVIGSDAGDTVYGIDLRATAPPGRYVESDEVGLGWDDVFWRGESFAELLVHLSEPLSTRTGGPLRAVLSRLRGLGR